MDVRDLVMIRILYRRSAELDWEVEKPNQAVVVNHK